MSVFDLVNLLRRELFGTSEDDTPDLDHTEDSENGKLQKKKKKKDNNSHLHMHT